MRLLSCQYIVPQVCIHSRTAYLMQVCPLVTMSAILPWTDHHSIIFVEYRFLCCFSYLVVLLCLCACPLYCAGLTEGSWLVDFLQFESCAAWQWSLLWCPGQILVVHNALFLCARSYSPKMHYFFVSGLPYVSLFLHMACKQKFGPIFHDSTLCYQCYLLHRQLGLISHWGTFFSVASSEAALWPVSFAPPLKPKDGLCVDDYWKFHHGGSNPYCRKQR